MNAETPEFRKPPGQDGARHLPPPTIPNYEMLHRIGRGGYGEVWLARTVIGEYRAVKVVYRQDFEDDHPFDREFEGIRKFEPISRSHPGLVNVLHIGRNDAAGFFHYVMELADDAGVPRPKLQAAGSHRNDSIKSPALFPAGTLVPSKYAARTLRVDLQRQGRLPFTECLRLGLALTAALEHLHAQGLVHRDIKPSNVIFVSGLPKLADIGLVASAGERRSLVGTEGFIAPEGPGTPQADLFSLGKLLYELCTGKPPQHFPEPLTKIVELPERKQLQELNEIILKACDPSPRKRYASAGEMLADLLLIQAGKSVRRLRVLERGRKWALTATAVATVAGAGAWLVQNHETHSVRLASQREVLARNAQMLRQGEPVAGWSSNALAFLREAGRVKIDDHLRAQAVATIAGLDVRQQKAFRNFGASKVAFDAAGRQLVMDGSEGGPAKIWDAQTDKLRFLSSTNTGPVWFTATGGVRQFAYRGGGVFVLLDPESGATLREFLLDGNITNEEFKPEAVEVSADGSRCAVALMDSGRTRGLIAVWEIGTGKLVAETNEICTALALSPNGACLAVGNEEGRVRILSLPDLLELASFQGAPVRVNSLAFQRALEQPIQSSLVQTPWVIAAGDAGGTIHIYDVLEVRKVRTKAMCRGSDFDVYALAFSPDGMTLASGGREDLRLWDVSTGRLLLRSFGWDNVKALAFSPDGGKLAYGAEKMFEPAAAGVFAVEQSGGIFPLRGLSSRSTKVQFSHNGRWLAALAHNWEVGVWNLGSNRLEWLLQAPKGLLADNAAFAFSPDDRQLAFATLERAVLWDLETGREVRSWSLPRGVAQEMCFDPAGRLILFQWERNGNSRGGYCTVRDLMQHDQPGNTSAVVKFQPFDKRILTAVLASDGGFIAVCGMSSDPARTNQILRVFEPLTGRELCQLPCRDWRASADMVLNPTASLLAHWSREEQQTLVYGMPSGVIVAKYPFSVCGLSSDGHWLAESISNPHHTVSIRWGVDHKRSLALGAGQRPQFSPDGRRLAWGTSDGTVYVCEFEKVIARLEQLGLGW